jgi:dipeptidyl aminopeptidase/acylaminoacyl peptidase
MLRSCGAATGSLVILLVVFLLHVAASPALAAADSPEQAVDGFPTVVRRAVEIWSDGTRLAGDLHYPKERAGDQGLPAIVLCHGWGGVKQHLNQHIAPRFAAAGFVVLSFDYRGWGDSDSRLVIQGPMPKPDAQGMVTVKALAVRELVDPLDQQEDIDAAITFVEGDPLVDPQRIGIWGSSFGGGHVIWRAAHDPRVKAVASQVGAMDQRVGLTDLAAIYEDRMRRARGELAPVPLDAAKPEGLRGTPYYERFLDFVPVDVTDQIRAPVLLIDADKEHYFDIKAHSGRVYQRLLGRVPVEYHVFENTAHYDVYRGAQLDRAMELEIAWFRKYLQ